GSSARPPPDRTPPAPLRHRNAELPADGAYETWADFAVPRHGARTGSVRAPPLGVLRTVPHLPRPLCPQVALQVAELQPARVKSSGSLRPAATLGSPSSAVSIRRSASITFSRASSRVRPWLSAPGTSTTPATIHPSSSGSSYVLVRRSF